MVVQNEVKYSVSNAGLLDTSGAANESWASTPVKIPPSILFQTVMSPVKLSLEDSNESVESDKSSLGSEEENFCSSESSYSRCSSSLESESDALNQSVFSCNSELSNQSVIDVDICQNFESKVLVAVRLSNLNLYEGSDLSVLDAVLKMMNLYLKNKESKVGLRRIVRSMSSLLPKGHNLPSIERILSLVQDLTPSVSEESHFFCKVCLVYREAGTSDQLCPVCDKITPQGQFFVFSVRAIVKYLFEYCNLASILESVSVNQDDNLIRDISDGSVYKTLNATRSKYDLTLILNSDGVKIRKGSKSELWVLLGTFVEIPIHLREAFISVFGLWYDEVKPDNMNTFLEPFSKEMLQISESGVEWTHPVTTEKNVSEVRIQLVVADAPARAKMQNILNFNGKHGCNVCEIKSVRCLPNPAFRRRIRIFPYKHNLRLRTAVRMETQARQAMTQGAPVKGVKGPSVLSIIPSVDIATCFIPEYLHSVLLGVVGTLITLWINKPGPWNIKNSLYTIDAELGSICHPDFVHRVSRYLNKESFWKASDYYYFLLFESLPILRDFLPELLMRSISESDLEEADLCLKLFVNAFAGIYSDRDLTYNIHQLLHLSLSVKRHGPLSCTSAFAFESMNGLIAKATHGANNVGKEIANNIKICKGVVVLKKISEGLHVYTAAPVFATEPLGDERKDIEITHEERNSLIGDFKIFSRAKIGYEVFTSLIHKKLKSVNYYVMCKINGAVEYASIKYFVKHNDNLKVCLKLFHVDHLDVIYNRETLKTIQHLIPVVDTDITVLVHGARSAQRLLEAMPLATLVVLDLESGARTEPTCLEALPTATTELGAGLAGLAQHVGHTFAIFN
ncbi:L-idonate 5-dehydrogenase (NAD(P)(+)) [Frankliniella fusca]|uniref:L-idonate 5-dehydrogenase (NAD(P)(+)) n=1 Tax=Frankliniella fusca TaxID=407009 RepID=A0AAE1HMU1_9NEOP|nr:L-idonate 5-dehydrogenase (NAD(P)(+)) [Frankliniella fusca]